MVLDKTFVWGWTSLDMGAAKALNVNASHHHEEYIVCRYRYILDWRDRYDA